MLRLGVLALALLIGGAAAVWKKQSDKKSSTGAAPEPEAKAKAKPAKGKAAEAKAKPAKSKTEPAKSKTEPAKSKAAKPKARPAKAAEPKAKPAKSEAAPRAEKATVAAEELTKIDGIGPKLKEILVAGGIRTCEDLANSSTGDLQKLLDAAGPRFRLQDPSTWVEQAKELGGGRKA